MIYGTGEELAEAIDGALIDYREKVGSLPGKRDQHVYEAGNGEAVLIALTKAEAFAVDESIAGVEIASENYEYRQSNR